MRATKPSPDRPTAGSDPDDDLASADLQELEARVLPFAERLVARVAEVLPRTPSRVADLDAGAGAGVLAMAARFSAAHLVAVDRSPVVVRRLERTFRASGLASRTTVVHARVDWAWTSAVPFDLVWAGTASREVGDPRGLVRAARCALRSGGIFAAAGACGPPSFLTDEAGGGVTGPAVRRHVVVVEDGGRPGWVEALEEACFVDITEEDVELEVTAPAVLVRRLAAAHLPGAPASPTGRVSTEDLAVLRDLLAADGAAAVAAGTALTLRATRTLWTARRP